MQKVAVRKGVISPYREPLKVEIWKFWKAIFRTISFQKLSLRRSLGISRRDFREVKKIRLYKKDLGFILKDLKHLYSCNPEIIERWFVYENEDFKNSNGKDISPLQHSLSEGSFDKTIRYLRYFASI